LINSSFLQILSCLVLFHFKEYKGDGLYLNSSRDHKKHLGFMNVDIVKKLGCQLIQRKDLNKDAKIA
jgi:hypothetical protein